MQPPADPVTPAPSRPHIERRAKYRPLYGGEEFIVPLIASEVERFLNLYATPEQSGRRALDIGCGGQPFRGQLEARGFHYTGMDVQQNAEGTVDVIASLDGKLPDELLQRGPFDFLLCTEVLEHVADWDAAFRNMAALMAVRGRLAITCPHFYPLHEQPYDFWRPTVHAIRFFGNRAGLKVVEERAAGNAWDVLGTTLACFTTSPRNGNVLLWPLALLVNAIKRLSLILLWSGVPQRFLRTKGLLYLTNSVILERT